MFAGHALVHVLLKVCCGSFVLLETDVDRSPIADSDA
ncbi:hypothetical protein KC19_2G280000 [Ceratodon purpureus]|uniref:Uncharacterized protein n=1 Tax=Ceratodon purpureus TaxID=3225 RepID=A0A8T0J0A8_CERPU|nr:hypothetical protein KC19_2G280000 [Ceratodon purpureus]